jgi:hypothetical protein
MKINYSLYFLICQYPFTRNIERRALGKRALLHPKEKLGPAHNMAQQAGKAAPIHFPFLLIGHRA